MTNYAQTMITNALTPIIKTNDGQLNPDVIPRYVCVLVATGAFIDEREIKQAFNELAWSGVFNLKGETHK